MAHIWVSLLLSLIFLSGIVKSSSCDPSDSREKFSDCSSCLMEAGSNCGWCLEPDQNNENLAKGCVATTECQSAKFVAGKTSETQPTRPGATGASHIEPKSVNLKLRPNVKHKVKFTAKRAQNAVDIYFLLDLSGSMGPYKQQLETIPPRLVEDIKKRTTDYQFGYGAFREKPMTPMSKVEKGKEFDFEHFQPLTKNTGTLKDQIRKSQVSANYDTPEAGFDGLMQVILCKDAIGWRDHSTHIIVFITDAPSHIAGDGLIGGIWKPYEHRRSLKQDGQKMIYNSLDNDYPSLSEINYMLELHEKTVIFGTSATVLPLYREMVRDDVIHRAAAGDIGKTGEGLRLLVSKEYEKIEGRIQISAKNINPSKFASSVKINFDSTCQDRDKITENEIICRNVSVNEKLSFSAEIELNTKVCETKRITFDIQVFGQSDSIMSVELNPICECTAADCSKDLNQNNPCNKHGDPQATKVCGACKCVEKQGDTCQCDKDGGVELDEMLAQCLSGPGKEECSGHGSCHCGVCKCNPGFFGDYCGCSKRNIDCGDFEGRGKRNCIQKQTEISGKESCNCLDGWSGKTCTCSGEKDKCMDPFTNIECNGDGKCECNQCECQYNEGYFCQQERNVNEDDLTCERLAPCILLDVYKHDTSVEESYKKTWERNCKENERYSCFIIVNSTRHENEGNTDITGLEDGPTNETETFGIKTNCKEDFSGGSANVNGLKKCSIPVDFKSCYIDVRHDATEGLNDYNIENYWRKNNLYVTFDNTERPQLLCPEKINMGLLMGSAGGAGLFLFIVGFLSFCIVINIRDRREYKRFIAEQEEVWGQGNVHGNKLHKERSSMRQSIRNRMSRVSFKS